MGTCKLDHGQEDTISLSADEEDFFRAIEPVSSSSEVTVVTSNGASDVEKEQVKIRYQTCRHGADEPWKATESSAGYDVRACDSVLINPWRKRTVGTGLKLKIPQGTCGKIYSRSGLASEHGIEVCGGVGIIDADYRGEMKVMLKNSSYQPYKIRRYDRIAQLIIEPVLDVKFDLDTKTSPAAKKGERGNGGFGSTGK